MTYDQWKCDPGYDDPPDECWCEDYETDWEGRATCHSCGRSWWLTADDYKHMREAEEAFDAYCRREERKRWIAGWVNWFAFWRRWRKPSPINDDVPF